MFIITLKNQNEFNLVNKHSKKLYSKHFILIIAQDLPLIFHDYKNTIFLGMKVSKKLSKKAVVRNKIKRRIRHLIRLVFHKNLKAGNLAVVVIPKMDFYKANFVTLNNELTTLISQFV